MIRVVDWGAADMGEEAGAKALETPQPNFHMETLMNQTCSCGASKTVSDRAEDYGMVHLRDWAIAHAFSCEAMKAEVLSEYVVRREMGGGGPVNVNIELNMLRALYEGIALKAMSPSSVEQ